jgi:polysaccharide pyruvyl transferase WcaK-like protein
MLVTAPFGFYGSGNIGDEATLQGFERLVAEHSGGLTVLVASQDPDHTARIAPSFRYYQYRGRITGTLPRMAAHLANSYVFPGGTPIAEALGDWPLSALAPMVEHAHRWGKTSVFVGIGLERITRPDLLEILRDRIIPHVRFWSVRSEKDRQRLLEYGASPENIIVAADMAWLLPAATPDFGKSFLEQPADDKAPLIGVNVNAEPAVLSRAPNLLTDIALALDSLVEIHGAHVVFLSNEIRDEPIFDLAAARKVLSAMRNHHAAILAPNKYLSPSEMMSVIDRCDMTISTRYHFCLFSALQNVPFVAIKRSDKVADLCADIAWPYSLSPEDISATSLRSIASSLISSRPQALEHLAARRSDMRQRSLKNLAALDIVANQKVRRSDTAKRIWSRFLGQSRTSR